MDADKILQSIVELDQRIADLEDQFDERPQDEKNEVLAQWMRRLLQEVDEESDPPIALYRVAEMTAAQPEGAAMLISGLSHPNEAVRHLFGDALVSIASNEGIEAIEPAVELALDKQDLAAQEMPFLLSWVDDPSALSYIARFLEADDPLVVFAAIDALVHLGDPEAVPALTKLCDDEREVPTDDEEDEGPITIGMLAQEAIDIIEDEE